MKGIGLKELAFVGYPVTDFSKARQFYGEILGLKESLALEHEGELGWLEYDLAGQTLALAKASDQWKPDPNGGGACLEVEDLDRAVVHLREHGVRIAMDIQDYPACRIALVADPDGNTLALHQRKANHPERGG
ncbi:MAG: VOC family protein [Chthoniobacterales bacterium]|nr:VOC family protein [Chthoniobacterales bacterium]